MGRRVADDRLGGEISRDLRTETFDFELPDTAIARRPAAPRDSARLLEVSPRALRDQTIRDLPTMVRPGDVVVLNDTKVIPAQLHGRRGDAKIAVTLHKRVGPGEWHVFARPGKRLRPGDRIDFAPDLWADVAEKAPDGEVRLCFLPTSDLAEKLTRHGNMPLPPYIGRPADGQDLTDYQTVYAAQPGAVAAPTAGLHFTAELLGAIEARGARLARLTLHIGGGTFLPVRTEFIRDHRIHAEWGSIGAASADVINSSRKNGGRVIAVGTTSLRLLEAAADESGRLAPFEGETSLFITPGYRFRIVEALLTNFHLPRSSLFMLVAAFAGLERMQQAYAHARDSGYRFYSYGDATLLHRQDRP